MIAEGALLLGLIAVLGPASPVQDVEFPAVSIQSWTTEDGLPQNTVSDLCFDAEGYLWVATYGGLARFDGKRFETYDVGSRADLPGNYIRSLAPGRDGDLWVGIVDAGLFRYRDDHFAFVSEAVSQTGIVEDRHGDPWGVSKEGVWCLREEKYQLVRAGDFRCVLPARDGTFWCSTAEGSLARIGEETEEVFGREAGLPESPLTVLAQDGNGLLWGGSEEGTWRASDAGNRSFVPVAAGPSGVLAITRDAEGGLWFGCEDQLVRWDPEHDSFTEIARGNHGTVLPDLSGNVWTGSTRGAALRCVRATPLLDATAQLQLAAHSTWCITEGRGGTVAVVQGTLVTEVAAGKPPHHEIGNSARTALVDGSGDLWIGHQWGLSRIRGDVRTEFRDVPSLEGGVRALFESRDGTLWIGARAGLSRRVGDDFVPLAPDHLVNIRCILEDAITDRFWVGTFGGLALVEGESVSLLTAEDGLSRGSVRSLYQDAEGSLWVGTYGGGLSLIDDGRITRFTRADGLSDNFITCILEDDHGRFWINSNRGPFVVRRTDLIGVARGELDQVACVLFSAEEGARESNSGYQPSGWHAPDGKLWFPTIEGVTIADPAALPEDEKAPKVLIEGLEVSERRELRAEFTALGFSAPTRVRIQHRLDGYDSDWIECVGPREVRYNGLAPGRYALRVRARNGFGPWSEPVSRSFGIEAKLYEEPWFLVAVVLVVGLGALGFGEYRLNAARKRAARLERLIEERKRAQAALRRSQAAMRRLSRELLKSQEAERSRLSRELHDDITQRLAALAMQAEFVESRLESGGRETTEGLRQIIDRSQELARDVQQLSRRLHPVGLQTLGLVEAVRQELDAFARRVEVEVELREDAAADEVAEDVALAAFRIFQESLHNVAKHADSPSLRVGIVIEQGDLVLTVTDRGRGFDFEPDSAAGLGLITMQERAASIGGRISVRSRPGEGTTVELRAPGARSPS